MSRKWGLHLEIMAEQWRSGDWEDRLHLGEMLKEQGSALTSDAISQARDKGASWQDIAVALNVPPEEVIDRLATGSGEADPAERGALSTFVAELDEKATLAFALGILVGRRDPTDERIEYVARAFLEGQTET